MQVINGTGKLYDADGKQVIATVTYQLSEKPQTEYTLGEWWGNFTPEDGHLSLKGEFILELEDGRKGRIIITNIRAQPGIPNHHQFQGSGSLT